MERGCLLAAQGEGVFGEDYQVFVSDGRAMGQVWVLGRREPAAGGKRVQPQGSVSLEIERRALPFESYLFSPRVPPRFLPRSAQPAGLNFRPRLKWQCAALEN